MIKYIALAATLFLTNCATWRAPLVVEQEIQFDDSSFRRLRNAEIAIGELRARQQAIIETLQARRIR